MSKGGKRDNCGRKKIGKLISIRIEEDILDRIYTEIDGKSGAEKIRNCLKKGLKNIDGENKL